MLRRARTSSIGAALLFFVLAVEPLHSATFTWDGGGANDYLSTAANWNPDSAPPFDGTADLVLAGTSSLNPFVLGTTWSIEGLTFDNTAGAFSIFGNPWHVGAGGIANNSASMEALNNVYVDSSQTWSAATGDLHFDSLYASGTTRMLTVDGTHNTTIAGSVDNASGTTSALGVVKNGSGKLTLSGGVKKLFAGDLSVNDGVLSLVGAPVAGSAALVAVGGNISVGTQGISDQNAVLDVSMSAPGLTITQIPTGFITIGSGPPVSPTGGIVVGAADGGTGTLNLSNGGIIETAAGGLVIHKTGTVNVGNASTTGILKTYGNVTIDGGVLEQHNGSSFVPYPSTTLTVQSGGRFTLANAYTLSSGRSATVTGEGSLLETAEGLVVDTAALTVEAAGAVSAASYLNIAQNAGGAIRVDGPGTTLNVGGHLPSLWGSNGHEADVIIDHGATAEFDGGISMASGTGIVYTSVINGAHLTVARSLSLSADDTNSLALLQIGNLNQDAGGASVTITPFGQLSIGTNDTSYTDGASPLSVYPGALLTVGAGGTTNLNRTGRLNIYGGTVDLQNFPVYTGQMLFDSGSLSYIGYVDIGPDTAADIRALGAGSQTIASNRSLTVSQGTYVHNGYGLTLAGGTLNTSFVYTSKFSSLYGTFDFQSGTLGITGPDGLRLGAGDTGLEMFGDQFFASTGKTLNITNSLVISPTGELILSGGTVTAGTLVNQDLLISNGGTLITGGLTNYGQVDFRGGITNVYGDVSNATTFPGITISGRNGPADVTFWGNVTNTADSRFSVSTGSSATFNGNYYGYGIVGSGDKRFAADISPGFSPASITFDGNVTLASTAKLNIELGGTVPGSDFDHVTVSATLSLDGALAVSLINGFSPVAGDAFDILDWGVLGGAFSTIELPTLSTGLTWNTSQLYTTGVLSVATGLAGDYNHNGIVDAADYAVWRDGLGTTYTLADYDVWKANFGNHAGSGNNASTAVPEPRTIMLFLIGILMLHPYRRLKVS
jgi:autotransporter-associated beta strand protein